MTSGCKPVCSGQLAQQVQADVKRFPRVFAGANADDFSTDAPLLIAKRLEDSIADGFGRSTQLAQEINIAGK
jgi:hypothetical protein